MSGATQRAPDLDEGEVEVVLNSQQQTIKAPAVLQATDQPRTVQSADHNNEDSNGLPSKLLWALFALGWLFPPCWWVAAAGLQAGGDAQCLIKRRKGQSRSQTAAWRASVVMTAVSAAVLLLALPIYYGRSTVPRAGKQCSVQLCRPYGKFGAGITCGVDCGYCFCPQVPST